MVVTLLAGLFACTRTPAEPAPLPQTWTQPEPALIEHRLSLPANQRQDLVPRVRAEMLAAARQQGLRRLETIEVELRCDKVECEATIQAMALP